MKKGEIRTKKNVMLLRFYITCFFITFFGGIAWAQHELEKPDSSKSTNKVQVFSNQPRKKYFDDGNNKEEKNLLKLNPTLILLGEIPIYYERRLNNHFSGEIGLGITLQDYLSNVFILDALDNNSIKFNYGTGVTMKSALRFFPDPDDFPEGMYFSAELRYKTYKVLESFPENNGVPGASFNINRKYTDFVLDWGQQVELDNNIYFEYYAGIGIRGKTVPTVSLENHVDNNGNLVTEYVLYPGKRTVPLFTSGIKLGFSF